MSKRDRISIKRVTGGWIVEDSHDFEREIFPEDAKMLAAIPRLLGIEVPPPEHEIDMIRVALGRAWISEANGRWRDRRQHLDEAVRLWRNEARHEGMPEIEPSPLVLTGNRLATLVDAILRDPEALRSASFIAEMQLASKAWAAWVEKEERDG